MALVEKLAQEIGKEAFIEFYSNHTREQTAKYFNTTEPAL